MNTKETSGAVDVLSVIYHRIAVLKSDGFAETAETWREVYAAVEALYAENARLRAEKGGWRPADQPPAFVFVDDKPCSMGGKPISPLRYSADVFVLLDDDSVSIDSAAQFVDRAVSFWRIHSYRVKAWQPLPANGAVSEQEAEVVSVGNVDVLAELRKLVNRAVNAAYSHGSTDEKEYKSDAYYRKAHDASDAARDALIDAISNALAAARAGSAK